MPSPQARSRATDRAPSTAVRVLEPIFGILWILFLLWTALVAATWFFQIGEAQLTGLFSRRDPVTGAMVLRNADLFGALKALLSSADVIWLALGMVNAYLALVRQVGIGTARFWALLIFATAWLIAAFSVWVNLPMGPLRFTARLGFKVGPVSLGWLLLWFCCVLGAREFVRVLAAKSSHTMHAVMTGALLGVVSIPLELVGWKVRSWWLWYPGQVPAPPLPPALSFLVWAIAGGLLTLAMRDRHVVQSTHARLGRLTTVFICIVALLGIALGTATS